MRSISTSENSEENRKILYLRNRFEGITNLMKKEMKSKKRTPKHHILVETSIESGLNTSENKIPNEAIAELSTNILQLKRHQNPTKGGEHATEEEEEEVVWKKNVECFGHKFVNLYLLRQLIRFESNVKCDFITPSSINSIFSIFFTLWDDFESSNKMLGLISVWYLLNIEKSNYSMQSLSVVQVYSQLLLQVTKFLQQIHN